MPLYWTGKAFDNKAHSFESVQGHEINLKELDSLELFYYRNVKGIYYIVEKNTGISLSNGKDTDEAYDKLKEVLTRYTVKEITDRIKNQIEEYGTVPKENPIKLGDVVKREPKRLSDYHVRY